MKKEENKREENYTALAKKIAGIIEDKKGEDTVALDISDLASFARIIMMSTARSSAQINAIMRELKKQLSDTRPDHIEGDSTSGWVLLDYDGLILNIFTPATREFYSLEKLWGDGNKIDV